TIDFLIYQLSKLLGFEWDHVSHMLYANEMGDHISIGFSSIDGRNVDPNAFYTSLYLLYRDAGVLGVVLFSFLYGYLFSREYMTYKYYQNARSLAWIVFFSWVGYSSLLTPIVMNNTFWFVPVIIYI